jgi:hypothetical protein
VLGVLVLALAVVLTPLGGEVATGVWIFGGSVAFVLLVAALLRTISLHVIGYDRSGGTIRTRMEVRLLDSKGKRLRSKPLVIALTSDNKEEVAKSEVLTFRGSLGLNRVGTFRLRITVFDEQGKRQTQFEAPLRVTAP